MENEVKTLKILLVNVLIVLFIFGCLEYVSYLFIKKDNESYMKPLNEYYKKIGAPLLKISYAPVRIFNQSDYESKYRPDYRGHKNFSILFFGCSYTYGSGVIENEKTLPYITGNKSDVTAVNRGSSGASILNMLYDLTHPELYDRIKNYPNPKYIIFTFISDHFNRISNPYRAAVMRSPKSFYYVYPDYITDNGEFKIKYPSKFRLFLYSLYTVKAWHYLYAQRFAHKTADDRMFELFLEAKKITDEKFPNSKFIIMLYKDGGRKNMPRALQKKLKKKGFIILDSEKLAGHELESGNWRALDKEHPNEAAYRDIAAGLIKELKL